MAAKIPKRHVQATSRAAQSFAVVYDDLDLDLALAHIEGYREALLADQTAFGRARKAAGPMFSAQQVRQTLLAFFDERT